MDQNVYSSVIQSCIFVGGRVIGYETTQTPLPSSYAPEKVYEKYEILIFPTFFSKYATPHF